VVLVSLLSSCAFFRGGQYVLDHRDKDPRWLAVHPKWRIGYPIPDTDYVLGASGWEEFGTPYRRGKGYHTKVLFHDPSVVVLVSIQSDGVTKPILKVDVEFHVPDGEPYGPVEFDLLQTRVRFDDREVSPIIHKRTLRSSPAMSEMSPLSNCYRSEPDCWTTIHPGEFQTGQLYVREFLGYNEFELDLPPMLLTEGRVVDAPPIRFTQDTGSVQGANRADPY
jgi:hypothetical protein